MRSVPTRSVLRWLLWSVGLAACYILLAWLVLGVRSGELILWPSAAVAAFGLIARGPSMAPAIVLASWVSNRLLLGWGWEASALIAAGDALGPLLGWWLLRRRVHWQGFETTADGLWFIGAMGLLGAGVSAALGAIAAAIHGFDQSPVTPDLGVQWWVTDMTGIVVLTPAAELLRRLSPQALRSASNGEMVLLPALAVVGTLLVYLMPTGQSALPIGLASLVMLPMLWSAMRLPLAVSASLTAVVSLLIVAATVLQHGPMYAMLGSDRFMSMQIILLAFASAMLLAGLLANERTLAIRQVRDINATLEKKVNRRTAALQISQATTQAQLRFQESLLNALPNPVAFSDPHGRFTRVNVAFNLLVGLSSPEIHGRTGPQILGAALGRLWEEMDGELLSGRLQVTREAAYLHPDHEPTVWILNKALVRDAVSRQIVGVVTSMQDITAIKQLQQQLSEDEQRFRFLAEESPVPLVITRTSDAALLFSNKAAEALFRGSYAQLAGQSVRHLWGDAVDRDRLLLRLQREGGTVRGVEAQFRRFDGTGVWLLLSVTRGRYRDDDALIFAFKDITEVKAREDELRNLAYTDTLTGIPNRRHFLARAALELRRAQREGSPFALLALDIDRFKQINDRLGHQAGDAVIRCFAQTCMQQLRGPDLCGRLGGDEFAILLPQTTRQVAFDVAQRLRLAIQEAGCLPSADQVGLTLTTSIGIAEFLPTSTIRDADELLDRADQALYRAKQSGRNRVEIWSGESPGPV
ncbi:MAG: diguanylate cyclase [Thiomonas sp.]|uniref:GGDEF domain-containing protein n=1 Tax=Thiomonas sp. TaxID=2047785 RepID=UPI002A359BBC|nr:diguanylate cyclase [Thiomonas sp.]MDY0331100.1 diguanylate cyclase [Thiomonas sp.]